MNAEIANKPVGDLTSAELKELMKETQRKENAAKVKAEKKYQDTKNQLVNELVHNALGVQEVLKEFNPT